MQVFWYHFTLFLELNGPQRGRGNRNPNSSFFQTFFEAIFKTVCLRLQKNLMKKQVLLATCFKDSKRIWCKTGTLGYLKLVFKTVCFKDSKKIWCKQVLLATFSLFSKQSASRTPQRIWLILVLGATKGLHFCFKVSLTFI